MWIQTGVFYEAEREIVHTQRQIDWTQRERERWRWRGESREKGGYRQVYFIKPILQS